MKRLIVGTAFCAVLVVTAAVMLMRWPVVFWLMALSVMLYLIFGRRADIEFRVGVGNGGCCRRFYAAVVWKRPVKANSQPNSKRAEVEPLDVEDRV